MPFGTILTPDALLNRIQANIQNALGGSTSNSPVITVNAVNFPLTSVPTILSIPTTNITGAAAQGVSIVLPDASKYSAKMFIFKKTDTTSNKITFVTGFKNNQNVQQTVENASSYSSTASLATGIIYSDGNNWWVG
jgi:hypothetical protein